MREDRDIDYYKRHFEDMLDGAMFNLKRDDYHKLIEELKTIIEDRMI